MLRNIQTLIIYFRYKNWCNNNNYIINAFKSRDLVFIIDIDILISNYCLKKLKLKMKFIFLNFIKKYNFLKFKFIIVNIFF